MSLVRNIAIRRNIRDSDQATINYGEKECYRLERGVAATTINFPYCCYESKLREGSLFVRSIAPVSRCLCVCTFASS